MSSRSCLLALGLCLLAAAPALAAKWEKVGDTPLAAVYLDKESLRRAGSMARAQLEWRWHADTEVPDSNGSRFYRLERQLQISNCANRSYAVAEGMRYGDARGADLVSSYRHDESALPYSEARPRTIRETLVDHMCRAEPAKKP